MPDWTTSIGVNLFLWTADAVFPHPAAKRTGVDTEHHRCAFFPFDLPPGFLERLEDMVAFEIDKGLVVLRFLITCCIQTSFQLL